MARKAAEVVGEVVIGEGGEGVIECESAMMSTCLLGLLSRTGQDSNGQKRTYTQNHGMHRGADVLWMCLPYTRGTVPIT